MLTAKTKLEPMWKLRMTDADGVFETWEIGDSAAEAVAIATMRRSSYCTDIHNVLDDEGSAVGELVSRCDVRPQDHRDGTPCDGCIASAKWDREHMAPAVK